MDNKQNNADQYNIIGYIRGTSILLLSFCLLLLFVTYS